MRGIVKFVFSLAVILAAAWGGLWWYVQGRLQGGFEAWAETQATSGITVSYGSIMRGTSPLRAEVTVTNLVLTLPQDTAGQSGTVTLPSLGLRIEALSPTIFHTDLPAKILVQVGNDFDSAITFASSAVTEQMDPQALFNKAVYPFRGGDFTASGIDVLASQGSLLVLHIDSLTSHSDINLNASAAETAVNTMTDFNGVALSPILTRIASIPFDGKINHIGFGGTISGPLPAHLTDLAAKLRAAQSDPTAVQKVIMPVIHQWASQGGSGALNLSVALGPTVAKADASVKFDANLQPEGAANLTANHLDELSTTLVNAYPALQDYITQAEAVLSADLTTTPQDGQALNLHLLYGNGAVSLNGEKMTDMPKVDWNSLENPPAATDQTGGDLGGDLGGLPGNVLKSGPPPVP